MTSTSHATDDRRRKTVLFCPTCDHEGPIAHDWLECRVDGVRYLVCPDCGSTVDRRTSHRPRPPAEAD
ncbi:hypothetical protein [Natrarchaeobaculum aegyptiacum]|uniref:DUF8106 domain-containing protein n=1 Tax=Natrarchaeobaculum aegyptiacum TaxID=745377 RepID=A0A2Z2HQ02_9EURY|nr:hypothetical protein [Natrarchaeobaculum aegyptiacum]ARS89129.1 hypothetical protein B1756_04725 [Natrarchaeobaculum aegyptiacum]